MQSQKITTISIEPIKLAVTISGAVSLGSFEAGALYELLQTIQKYNFNCINDKRPPIKIDVFTGASAGGMTSAIAVQHLLYDGKSFIDKPTSNPLYEAWVETIDLQELSKLKRTDEPGLSIFSSTVIHDIADKFIGQDFGHANIEDAHPAAAEKIRVGLALSNLTGVDYAVEIWGGSVSPQKSNASSAASANFSVSEVDGVRSATSEFVYTKYADQQQHEFTAGNFVKSDWDNFTPFVVSCGAFPFAFRPVDINVANANYFDQGARKENGGSANYLFTDGGVFQNEPLGLAKAIVDEIDADHLHNQNRFYVYIAPGLKGSTIDNQPPTLREMDAVTMARTVAKAVFNQSRFQDWISTEDVNKQIAVFDRRACALKDDLINNRIKLNEQDLLKVVDPLLSLLFDENIAEQDKQLDRLRSLYSQELSQFQDAGLGEAWLKSVLVFETTADLGSKDEMQIFGITADENELASSRLFAFSGFFDRKLRDHDYAVGRKKTRQVLRTVHQIKEFVDTDDDSLVVNPALTNFDVLAPDVEPPIREKLEAALDRGTNYLLHSVLNNWISIKHVVANIARMTSVATAVAAVAATLIIFSLGVWLGSSITRIIPH